MDADVISIETARSKMELLDAFTTSRYPNETGPVVYDIHAPRLPATAEMAKLLAKEAGRLATDKSGSIPTAAQNAAVGGGAFRPGQHGRRGTGGPLDNQIARADRLQ